VRVLPMTIRFVGPTSRFSLLGSLELKTIHANFFS
jgi:hypothetical protein